MQPASHESPAFAAVQPETPSADELPVIRPDTENPTEIKVDAGVQNEARPVVAEEAAPGEQTVARSEATDGSGSETGSESPDDDLPASKETDQNAGREVAAQPSIAGVLEKTTASEFFAPGVSAGQTPKERMDFGDEEAALAAREAGLDMEEETPEEAEQASADAAVEDMYVGKNGQELVALFARMLDERPVQSLRRETEALKIAFYKQRRVAVEAERHAFIEQGGAEADFVPTPDTAELRLKDLFREYRQRRDEFIASLDAEKEANLQVKLRIIEELKELVGSDETLNHTFNKFRELQTRWKETGLVPQAQVKDLWETYNLHVENFYNFIKINKELRDLDLKKNYEQKVALCEQAEALLLDPSVVEAFHKLQKLHDQWRETGPVANEHKEMLWERFKAASSRINKQHQEHFETLKSEQTRNLELKTQLCVAAEELLQQPLITRRDWNKANDRLLEIQKTWKTIGFAPKKDNNRIYERFRGACDQFFEAKRTFYAGVKDEMEHNLQLKTELCEAAESLMNSEEWKKATDELIALQIRWKEIGAVPRRYSDQIWKRFRAACDRFFVRKAEHFAAVDSVYEENLQRKLALLDEMAAADVKTGGYEVIKEFQRRWGEIGYVPIKQKDAVQKRYKAAVDAMFDTLRGTERDRSMGRFREKVASIKAAGGGRMRTERERLYNKVRQLEQDIAVLENNIGFFARSKNADALVAEVQAKINRAREEMQAAIEKVKLIDRENRQENSNENK